MDELAEQAVDAINDISGKHEGHRAAHAKGTVLAGTFTPSSSGLTMAAHMQDEPVRVTARVSNGGGDPAIPDYAKEGRGLAVKFYLPDGSRTDVVALRPGSPVEQLVRDATDLTAAVAPWLQADHDGLTGTVLKWPEREEIDAPVQESLIVELYSK